MKDLIGFYEVDCTWFEKNHLIKSESIMMIIDVKVR